MTITKVYCDRCRQEFEYPVTRKIFLSGVGREGGYDLCDNCHRDLYNWFYELGYEVRCVDNESK